MSAPVMGTSFQKRKNVAREFAQVLRQGGASALNTILKLVHPMDDRHGSLVVEISGKTLYGKVRTRNHVQEHAAVPHGKASPTDSIPQGFGGKGLEISG